MIKDDKEDSEERFIADIVKKQEDAMNDPQNIAEYEEEADERVAEWQEDKYTKDILTQSEKMMDDPNEAAEYLEKIEKQTGNSPKSLKDFKRDTRKSLIKDDLVKQETISEKVQKKQHSGASVMALNLIGATTTIFFML